MFAVNGMGRCLSRLKNGLFQMRWRRRLTYVAVGLLFYFIVRSLKHTTDKEPTICKVKKEVRDNLRFLTDKVHTILKVAEVTHFLCYGSLWGALRMEKRLPWEENVDFCAVNQEAVYLDEASFLRSFRRHGLDLQYDWSDGVYFVFNTTKASGYVCIYMFELMDSTTNMMKRVGWKRRVLPPDCEGSTLLNCFPVRLIKPPLSTVQFEGMTLPAPREGIEIQKYHYESDWWKEVRPYGCY